MKHADPYVEIEKVGSDAVNEQAVALGIPTRL